MAYLADRIFDAGLQLLIAETDGLYVCSRAPATFLQATQTYALGYKASPSFSGPEDGTLPVGSANGRQVRINPFEDGVVTDTAVATHYALVDGVNHRLLAVQAFKAGMQCIVGAGFSIENISIRFPDAGAQ